ncbi:DUF47 family protein [Candidatus Roizmanbacteria bacterium]|nr:DUF47 family protein [Candidatus Roizmanbacteria bacterium]
MEIFPRSFDFFERFDELSNVIQKTTNLLTKVKIGSPRLNDLSGQARRLEIKADELCHELHKEVDLTFITPIDREDIYILARNLDNIVDLIENLISNIATFSVKKEEHDFNQFVRLIASATKQVVSLISNLKFRGKRIDEMRKLIVKINQEENKGDELVRNAYKNLFSNHTDPVELMKWKDLYATMEAILDECENVAYLVDEIIIKNF